MKRNKKKKYDNGLHIFVTANDHGPLSAYPHHESNIYVRTTLPRIRCNKWFLIEKSEKTRDTLKARKFVRKKVQ